jgi:hypothetical protein
MQQTDWRLLGVELACQAIHTVMVVVVMAVS